MNELMFNAHFPAALHNSHFLCHRRVSSAAAFSASASFLPFVIAMMEHYGSGERDGGVGLRCVIVGSFLVKEKA